MLLGSVLECGSCGSSVALYSVHCALRLQHPFAWPAPLSDADKVALKLQADIGENLVSWRTQMSKQLTKLKEALADTNDYLLRHGHPWLRLLMRKRNVGMM